MSFQPIWKKGALAKVAGDQLGRVDCGRTPLRGFEAGLIRVRDSMDGGAKQIVVLL